MKNLVLLFILGILPLAAMGQEAPATNEITITGPTIQLPSQAYPMHRYEFNKFKGFYDLSNGMTLRMFSQHGIWYAKITGQPAHEIVAATPETFVARDRQMEIVLDHEQETLNGESEIGGKVFMAAAVPNRTNGDLSSN